MIGRATRALIADLHRQARTSGCHTEDDGVRVQVDGSFEVAPLVLAVLQVIDEREGTHDAHSSPKPER